MRSARIRPRRHARQTHVAHQALHALAVDHVARRAQEHDHAPAAIKRPAGIFLVNQRAQRQVVLVLVRLPGRRLDPAVHRCARHASELTLARQRQLGVPRFDPAQARLLVQGPSFFLSQSTSIFSRPISPYSLSSGLVSSMGLGPRLASNKAPAFSRISFFHWPTRMHTELLRDFRYRFDATDGLQTNLGLELGRVHPALFTFTHLLLSPSRNTA